MELKIFMFRCDYESPLDGCSVVAKNKKDAVNFLSTQVEYKEGDWEIKEVKIVEGLII